MIDTSLFGRLKRLFSTDVIIRNVGGNQVKVLDTDHIQSTGVVQTNMYPDRYQRIYTGGLGTYVGNAPYSNYTVIRPQLYNDYEVMDGDPIVASVLDIVADESTLKNGANEVLAIKSSDENIQRILYNLFYDVLNIEFNLWGWIRSMCKYGDFYLHLHIAEKYGVYQVIPLNVYNVIREEGLDPKNPAYVRFRVEPNASYTGVIGAYDNNDQIFDNYEIANFRLLGDYNFLPYGRSYIEPARKIFKQLALMEDAMLIHRILRAPQRRVYYVDTGNIPPNEIPAYMEKLKSQTQRTPFVDPKSGEYNLRYNMMNVNEDFYVPVRGGNTSTKIDTLPGLEYNAIEDVVYLRDKMLAAMKVPKAFLGYEADVEGKSTLAQQDIRFARTIERIQRIVVSELTKIALVHLYAQGYTDENLTNFELELTTPSIVYDQERVALMKEKVDLAKNIMDTGLFPTDYIYDYIFHMSEDKYDEMRDLVVEDKKRFFRLSQIENEGNDPVESGQSYGTPHDLASLYGKGRNGMGEIPAPDAYDETNPVGRPQEKTSIYNTQRRVLGKDPLGKSMDLQPDSARAPEPKGGSPLSLESTKAIYVQNKKMLEEMFKKSNVFDKETVSSSLLDESNIKDIE
jgi:hypothetical protein